jgi:hypothetical protein
MDNLKGRRFGKRVVLRRAGTNKWHCVTWLVRCDCGKRDVVISWNLKSGQANCCKRCWRRQGGLTVKYKAEYAVFTAMLQRCFNRHNHAFENYGGRGITVAPCWLGRGGFLQFILDMGKRPKGKSLDRRNVEGPYSPENCRWADDETQNRNKRCNYTPEQLAKLREQALDMNPTLNDLELDEMQIF